MRCYEQELKKPVRNLINGELARSLLIQVQGCRGYTPSVLRGIPAASLVSFCYKIQMNLKAGLHIVGLSHQLLSTT